MIAALPLRFEIAREEKLYQLTLRTLAPATAKINATAVGLADHPCTKCRATHGAAVFRKATSSSTGSHPRP